MMFASLAVPLPAEQPIEFEVVTSMKTAITRGVTIRNALSLRADEVI